MADPHFIRIAEKAQAMQHATDPVHQAQGKALFRLIDVEQSLESFRKLCLPVPVLDTGDGWVLQNDDDVPVVCREMMDVNATDAEGRRLGFSNLLERLDEALSPTHGKPWYPMISYWNARWLLFYKPSAFQPKTPAGRQGAGRPAWDDEALDPVAHYFQYLQDQANGG